jgi:hypothetical protein
VFDHYFMTADPAEIAGLDGGAYGGVFVRTGKQLYAWDGPRPGTVDVCRFFTTPGTFGLKSSHFYTGERDECAGPQAQPELDLREDRVLHLGRAAGLLAGPHSPIYRMYNNGMTGAPNHRFTTRLAIYTHLTTTSGWAPEGVPVLRSPGLF